MTCMLAVCLIFQTPTPAWHELDWEKWILREGMFEVNRRGFILPDRSEIDVESKDIAYEIDFANKWKEAIGQSLFYGISTGKRPGIILLMGKGNPDLERLYYLRCLVVCGKHGITLRTVKMRNHY